MNASKISLWFWLTVASLVIGGLLLQNWASAAHTVWDYGTALIAAHLFCNPDWSEGED